MSFYRGEICDKIHGTIRKRSGGGCSFRWEEGGSRWLSIDFELLTCPASLDIIFNISS